MRILISKWFHHLRKIDRIIRLGVDKSLPKNLTIRYVAALIAVATLAISGQLMIQASLLRQTEDQRKLRLLERQIHDSENLRKALLSLEFSSKDSQIKLQIELIDSLSHQLQNNGETLKIQGIEADLDHSANPLTSAIQTMKTGLNRLFREISAINSGSNSLSVHQLSSFALELLNQESNYRSALTEISNYYDRRLEQQIAHFKTTELFLLFTTLLVLFIEALYVFRPGVENLYDALRIRSDFLGRMGHEMRNPMNSILGMTHLLFETPLSNQQQKYLSILQKSSSGLLEVLNNLLDFSSLESGNIKVEQIRFNLYKLLERAIDLAVYGAHAHGIELVLDLGIDVPLELMGDPVRLQQILTNLLGNAVKFTQKGEVILKVKLVRRLNESWLQFSVIDTGIGIEQEKISKIFDAFVQEDSTVRRRFGGTGLGLSISKDLVHILGGTLSVESQKNLGSRFYFSLPMIVSPTLDETDKTVSAKIQTLHLNGYSAWIAEPNDAIAELLTQLIGEGGGTPSRIPATEQLSHLLEKINPNAEKNELILLDYDSSKELLNPFFARIRRESLQTDALIFLIKTTASSTDIEKLAEHGIRNFIFKPIKPLQLFEAIEQGLAGLKHPKNIEETLTNPTHQVTKPELIHDSRALRVLAVDDSKDNQFLVKAYLKSLPYRITFADNGRVAVEKFKAAQFDIVLMDLQMPEMDGYTATQVIREWESQERIPPVPVVAISAHDHESESSRFKTSQFSSYLVKPISPNQLRKVIFDFTRHIQSSDLPTDLALLQDTAMAELEKQITDLAPQYLSNRRKELQDLRKWLEHSHFEQIQSMGHRLKGNAKSYGFEALGLIGKRLEQAAENRDIPELTALTRETEEYLKTQSLPRGTSAPIATL